MAEKKQLQALHQQRVQSDLNDKKRHAMEHYMDALTTPDADVSIRSCSKSLSLPYYFCSVVLRMISYEL